MRRMIALTFVALASTAASAAWDVRNFADPLGTATGKYAAVSASRPFEQFGRDVRATLIVTCHEKITPGRGGIQRNQRMGAAVHFSETVAIGERLFRWRVDDQPVGLYKGPLYGDGKTFYLSGAGPDLLPGQIANGQRLRVDADLPWAGQTLIEFDIAGAKEALAQLPCT